MDPQCGYERVSALLVFVARVFYVVYDSTARIFDEQPFPGGLTYSGHRLACASAVASIGIFKDESVVEHAGALGNDVLGPELWALA